MLSKQEFEELFSQCAKNWCNQLILLVHADNYIETLTTRQLIEVYENKTIYDYEFVGITRNGDKIYDICLILVEEEMV